MDATGAVDAILLKSGKDMAYVRLMVSHAPCHVSHDPSAVCEARRVFDLLGSALVTVSGSTVNGLRSEIGHALILSASLEQSALPQRILSTV